MNPWELIKISLNAQILKSYPIQIGQPTEFEQFVKGLKVRMIDDLVILKSMVPGVALAISRLSTGLAEESKPYCLNQIHFIYEKIRDMHILSLILSNRPHLSLLDEDTVENIRRETRKLLGTIIPNLISEIATAKKDAKTYQNIGKYFTLTGQSISNLDLYLVGYSGDETE